VRAVRAQTGVVVWGDVAVASVFTDKVVADVVARPSVAVAAVVREARKVRKYAPRLPAADPLAVFTPWCGRCLAAWAPRPRASFADRRVK